MLIPPAAVDVRPELMETEFVPFVTVKAPTFIVLLTVTSVGKLMLREARGAVEPTGPLKTTEPVQGLKLKVSVSTPAVKALTDLLKVIVPAAPQE